MNLPTLNKINIKQKIFYSTLFFTSFAVASIYFVILPAKNDIKTKRAEIITQKIEAEKKLESIKNMSKLGEKVKKIEPQLEKLDKVFINSNRQLEFITSLEKIADNNGINQKISLNTEKTTEDNNYQIIPLDITASGNFPNLMSYLNELEATNYYISINSINIGKSISQPNNRILNIITPSQSNLNLTIKSDTFWKYEN